MLTRSEQYLNLKKRRYGVSTEGGSDVTVMNDCNIVEDDEKKKN